MTEVFRGPGGGVVHADVLCLSVVGNQADIQGTVTRSTVEDQSVGATIYFQVSDNGEPGTPSDQFAPATERGGTRIELDDGLPMLGEAVDGVAAAWTGYRASGAIAADEFVPRAVETLRRLGIASV